MSRLGLTYQIYLREAQSARKSQLSCTDANEVIEDFEKSAQWYYVMSSDNRVNACQHAMRLPKSSGETKCFWKTFALVGTDFAAGCIQMFNVKSVTSLTAETLQVYSLHVTLLKFTTAPVSYTFSRMIHLSGTSRLRLVVYTLTNKESRKARQREYLDVEVEHYKRIMKLLKYVMLRCRIFL